MLDPVTFAIGIYALGATVIGIRAHAKWKHEAIAWEMDCRSTRHERDTARALNAAYAAEEADAAIQLQASDAKRRNIELELTAERARVSVLEAQLKALKDKAGERTRKGNLTRYARRRAAMEVAA